VIETIQQNRRAIADACRRFGVGRLEVFGSAVRGDFDAQESDLDFIANFLPPLHPGVADRFFGLAEALERIFSRPVDLLTDAMIRNPVLREEVNRNRTLIYDHGGQVLAGERT
jgi:predicted nucleotidyltransferase